MPEFYFLLIFFFLIDQIITLFTSNKEDLKKASDIASSLEKDAQYENTILIQKPNFSETLRKTFSLMKTKQLAVIIGFAEIIWYILGVINLKGSEFLWMCAIVSPTIILFILSMIIGAFYKNKIKKFMIYTTDKSKSWSTISPIISIISLLGLAYSHWHYIFE